MAVERKSTTAQSGEYQDTGCDLFHSCLVCPRVRCKYDDPAEAQRERSLRQDQMRLDLMTREGLTVREAAVRFGVTARTVHRILARTRDKKDCATATPVEMPHG